MFSISIFKTNRADFVAWIQKAVPTEVRKEGIFAEMLTRSLLTADKHEAPSTHTIQAVEWACQGGPDLQKACLWGVYRFFILPRELLFFVLCFVFFS